MYSHYYYLSASLSGFYKKAGTCILSSWVGSRQMSVVLLHLLDVLRAIFCIIVPMLLLVDQYCVFVAFPWVLVSFPHLELCIARFWRG